MGEEEDLTNLPSLPPSLSPHILYGEEKEDLRVGGREEEKRYACVWEI